MRKLMMLVMAVLINVAVATDGYCAIKYIGGYIRSDGTYVSGHFRDTSCDGIFYNNANYLGLND